MSLQERITELLDESGKSGSELASYCKITRAAVSKWRTGQVDKIDSDTVDKVARFFGVNPDWVRKGKGPKYLHDHSDSNEKIKLFEIIETADKAMIDSGLEFSEAERLDYYFVALNFAGRQHFSKDLITLYMTEIIRSGEKR